MDGFDRIAPFYDALAWPLGFGAIRAVERDLLDRVGPVPRALVLGGGTGAIAVALAERASASRIVFLEPSAGMLARARRRLARHGLTGRVELRRGGVEAIGEDERFDLVVTPFVLDLFGDEGLERVVARLDGALAPGGRWLFADFVLDRAGAAGRALVAGLYAFFRAACGIEARRLPDFDAAFARRGYVVRAESRRAGDLLAARILVKRIAPPAAECPP